MRARDGAVFVVLIWALSGCGGGGSGGAVSSGTGTAYDFVPPTLNSTRTYSETIVDNSNNTINIGFTDAITAVNSDGTVSEFVQSSTGSSAIVNGSNYAVATENQSFNDMGQETGYVYTAANGSPVTCAFDPHGTGPDSPIRVGETWDLDYTLTCGSGSPVAYVQKGSVVDVESITVPAGTYTAVKLQSTVTWTDAQGTTRTQTVTNWRDVATSISVKQSISIAYGGTLPNTGYAVSREILLESTS